MIMFITVCAIIVIEIVVVVMMDRIIEDGCLGCKYLSFWDDGSPLCTKSIDGVCIPNGFKYREREEEVAQKEWLAHSDDWKQGWIDYVQGNDITMTKEEKANKSDDWKEGARYAHLHPTFPVVKAMQERT